MIACGFFLWGSRGLGRRWEIPLLFGLMAAFGLPLSWQNLLSGFHSQQFFLIGLSFGAMVWLPIAPPWSRRWWLGAVCALLALGSMASGLLAAAMVLVLVLLRRYRREITWAHAFPTLGLCTVFSIVGGLSQVRVPFHDPIMAGSVRDFVMTSLRSLQWPGPSTTWFAAAVWLPWCLLLGQVLRRGRRVAPGAEADANLGLVLAGLGAWVVLQVMATAYARGAGGPGPSSRYLDTLVFGLVVNALALPWLWQSAPSGSGSRRALALLGLVWAAGSASGMARQAVISISGDLPSTHGHFERCERNVRNYLATGVEACLQAPDIPYPSASSLLQRIRIPVLRELLPVSVRPPIALTAANGPGPFVRMDSRARATPEFQAAADGPRAPTGLSPPTPLLENRVTWGSFAAEGTSRPGNWSSSAVHPDGKGFLRFEVAGDLGEPGATLKLFSAGSRAVLAEIHPSKIPGNAWRTVYVREPRTPFVVQAQTGVSGQWLAFTEPVEMGPLSYWAWRMDRNGIWIAGFAAAAALLLSAEALVGARRAPGPLARPGTKQGT
jgi:hypothetical protein